MSCPVKDRANGICHSPWGIFHQCLMFNSAGSAKHYITDGIVGGGGRGALKQQTFSHSLKGWKSKIKVQAGQVSLETSFLGLCWPPSHCVLTCCSL